MAETIRFRARIYAPLQGMGWTFVTMPKAASAKLGRRGRVPIAGTMNRHRFRTSAFPDGKGSHMIQVNAAMKSGGGADVGDTVAFALRVATDAVRVTVPPALQKALRQQPKAWDQWNAITPKARAEWVAWIGGAKRDATKAARTAATVSRLAKGAKRPSD